jgi:DNA uptake protein ComE-like DNA-binding protein
MKTINKLLDPVTRVSMMQTSLNCAANTFQGKGVPAAKLSTYATQLYTFMMRQFVASESGKVITPTSTTIKAGTKVVRTNRKSTAELLKRVRANQKRK